MDDLITFLRAREDERERYADDYPPLETYTLADVDAKRQIIDRAEELWESNTHLTPAGDALDEYREVVLPTLALPYAGHPDYREDWRAE